MRYTILFLLAVVSLGPVLWAVGADVPKRQGGAAPNALPLTQVVLYSSGVGYFEREGQVEGSAKIDLRFKVDDINDLLKSLVVQDFDGGQVAAVNYGSRDPIDKTLKSFGIDLTDNPTLGDLLNQVRGERIEISTPKSVTGTIVGVEKKKRPTGRDDDKVVELEYLNLLTDDGLRAIPLDQVQGLKMLDERLATELRQALEVLATGHDTQKKTVELRFDGQGKRRARVAYVVQTPVWKTSYRLVLSDAGAPYLQGWAIVENTTDEDWDSVRLALISGRPISFIMDLYQPLYAPRPEVQPELYLSLRPQVYGGVMEPPLEEQAKFGALRRERKALPRAMMAAPAPAAPAVAGLPARMGELAESLEVGRGQLGALDLRQGVTAGAGGSVSGELFEYTIKSPVTLARQRSAMLPIVAEEVKGEKLSIYNQSVQPKHPLNGFRLKNTSSLHLMQGPITVFDAGAYAGDARIEDIAPGGERLISYALDLQVEVEPQHKQGPRDLISVALRKGTMIVRRRATDETVYQVRNRDRKEKTVLVEHPFRSDWELKAPKKPAERTRDVYRFAVPVAAGKSDSLRVAEERLIAETIALADVGPNVLMTYIAAPAVSDQAKAALNRVIELRHALEQTRAERARREQRIGEITQEQGRIRENMTRLGQNSDLYNRYVKILDQQETDLEGLRREIERLKDTETKQQQALEKFLLSLDLEG
jgi:hypothetical protein